MDIRRRSKRDRRLAWGSPEATTQLESGSQTSGFSRADAFDAGEIPDTLGCKVTERGRVVHQPIGQIKTGPLAHTGTEQESQEFGFTEHIWAMHKQPFPRPPCSFSAHAINPFRALVSDSMTQTRCARDLKTANRELSRWDQAVQ